MEFDLEDGVIKIRNLHLYNKGKYPYDKKKEEELDETIPIQLKQIVTQGVFSCSVFIITKGTRGLFAHLDKDKLETFTSDACGFKWEDYSKGTMFASCCATKYEQEQLKRIKKFANPCNIAEVKRPWEHEYDQSTHRQVGLTSGLRVKADCISVRV